MPPPALHGKLRQRRAASGQSRALLLAACIDGSGECRWAVDPAASDARQDRGVWAAGGMSGGVEFAQAMRPA